MLLGKRPRPPMRRTTSMRALSAEELNLEVPGAGAAMAMAIDQKQQQQHPGHHQGRASLSAGGYQQAQVQRPTATGGYNPSAAASAAAGGLSPRAITTRGRRPSADLMELSHFLRACSLCKRRIAPGRDIYMYRGDTACCSPECRQQKMNIDEKKEKCSMTSMKRRQPLLGLSPPGKEKQLLQHDDDMHHGGVL